MRERTHFASVSLYFSPILFHHIAGNGSANAPQRQEVARMRDHATLLQIVMGLTVLYALYVLTSEVEQIFANYYSDCTCSRLRCPRDTVGVRHKANMIDDIFRGCAV